MGRKYRDQRLYDRGGRHIWARVRDVDGYVQRVSTKCTDEKAASDFADEWERRAASPSYRAAAEAELGSALTDFLSHMKRTGVAKATYDIAVQKLGHFVRLWGSGWPLLRITNDLVLQYIDTREREPGVGNRPVKPLTIKRELQHLERVLKWAKFRGVFPRDTGEIFPPDYSGKHKPKTRAPSPEEVVKLLMQLEPRRGAHVAYIVATGCRVAEAGRACLVDVDFPALVVRVRGSKTEKASDPVPITGLTQPFLVYALQHAPGKAPLFDPWGKYWRDIQAACVRAGIAPLSPNDLRRAFGTWHRKAGISAEQVSILLRHATDRLAQTTYARITGADIGEDVRMRVPVLYAETAESHQNSPDEDTVNAEKPAPPAGIGPATFGLGNLTPADASSRRSLGNKLSYERRRKRTGVRDLNEKPNRRGFWGDDLDVVGFAFRGWGLA